MSSYIRNINDEITIFDSLGLQKSFESSVFEAIQISDAIQVQSVHHFARNTNDSVRIYEKITNPKIGVPSDSITISDSVVYNANYTKKIILTSAPKLSAASPAKPKIANPIYNKLSGITINQNQFSKLNLKNISRAVIEQEFKLPSNYIRSNSESPDITGFQIYTKSLIGLESEAEKASLRYAVYRQPYGKTEWINLAQGRESMYVPNKLSQYASNAAESVWFNIRSFGPISIEPSWIKDKFKIVITEFSNNVQEIFYQKRTSWSSAVSYKKNDVVYLTISGKEQGYLCTKDNLNKDPSLYSADNADKCWERDPFVDIPMLVTGDGVQNMPSQNESGVLTFRVFSAIADDGTDFLNNQYRASVSISDVNNVLLNNTNKTWTSKPNPSKFGVESLYFDVTNRGSAVDINSVLVDPITPGMAFNVYYSNETPSSTLVTDSDWDSLLWTRVPATYIATKRRNYIFPESISAKYVKIEFTNLQSKYYAAGDFQKPILYKKYPQWVFDYFIADYMNKRNKTYDPYIQGQASVTFDVYQLAYNYYKGDIVQTSAGAIEIKDYQSNKTQLLGLITNNNNSNISNSNISNQIRAAFDQFQNHPALANTSSGTVGKAANDLATTTYGLNVEKYKIMTAQNYPVEKVTRAIADPALVSTTEREPLLLEKHIPNMFFFVNCRHEYKEAYAKFDDNRAYFAGVKEIAFQNENHTSQFDSQVYNYGVGQNSLNIAHNDFTLISDQSADPTVPQYFWSAK